MSSSIYYRMLGQGATLTMHASNSLVMFLQMQNEELMRDPDIKNMCSMQSRYLTVWNIAIQLSYFSLATACDFLTVIGRDNLIPKGIRRFRQTFFSAVVFPMTTLVFVVFWPIFLFDRELLFPSYVDKIFSFKSNLVMHLFIMPAALWELVFLPRAVPKSHKTNAGIIVILNIIYNAIILHTHSQLGLFPYPMFTMTYGTIYFPIILIVAFFIVLGAYILQWKLTSLIWGGKNKKMK